MSEVTNTEVQVEGATNTLPPYLVQMLARPHLDERLTDLIADYKACGMAVVASVIEQRPDLENAGKVVYDGGLYYTFEMSVAALKYAADNVLIVHDEYVAAGKDRVESQEEEAAQ